MLYILDTSHVSLVNSFHFVQEFQISKKIQAQTISSHSCCVMHACVDAIGRDSGNE